LTVEVLAQLLSATQAVLQKAGYETWELPQLEEYLKNQGTFSAEQQESLMKFWRVNKPKIHAHLVRSVSWNNSLSKLSWRIDSKTRSRGSANTNAAPEVGELTAIVEMTISPPENTGKAPEAQKEVVRFELDQTGLAHVLQELNSIQKQIQKLASAS